MTADYILLVHDDPAYLERLERALSAVDYAVDLARGVSEAFVRIAETGYAAVVVALDSPESLGTELIRHLAQHAALTECILVSREPAAADFDAVYSLGNVYSHRATADDELCGICLDVARAVERRSLRRQNAYLLMELRNAREDLEEFKNLPAVGLSVDNNLRTGALCPLLTGISRYAEYLSGVVQDSDSDLGPSRKRDGMSRYLTSISEAAEECLSLLRLQHGTIDDHRAEEQPESGRSIAAIRKVA